MDTDAPPRRLEYMALDALEPNPGNPKAHADADIDAALDRFGIIDIITIDERTGRLISGHGRVESFRRSHEAGEPAPEGVTVTADGLWTVPVARGWSSRDDAEARAALVALNQIPIKGGFVPDALGEMLAELQGMDGGLVGVGFDHDDVDSLLAELGAGELPVGDTDAEYAELPERGAPAAPREVQGLREVGLMFQDDHHREYLALLAQLRQAWDASMPAPMVVLRAMRQAAEGT